VNIEKIFMNETIRSDCYRLLAACFYYPKKEVFIQDNLFENLTEAFKKICPSAAVFSKDMEEAISRYSDEELLVDYSKLFVGPYELKAPPYGSVYLDDGRRVMGESTMQVISIYRNEGLVLDKDFKELPDHIAVELEFMSFLIYQELKALEKNDFNAAIELLEKQEMFLNCYLRWVPQFCEKIKEGTDNSFYSALADCLDEFVVKSDSHISSTMVTCNKSFEQIGRHQTRKTAKIMAV